MAIQKYIQDPNNPNASIPNPAYDLTRTQKENDFNQANLSSSDINNLRKGDGNVTSLPQIQKPQAITSETVKPTTTVSEITIPESGNKQTMPKVSQTTLADLGFNFDQTPDEKAMEEARQGILKTYPTEMPNEGDIRKKTLDEFQQQIDAMEMAKKQKLADIERSSQERLAKRLGGSRAILAGSGMLGQVGGESVQQGIMSSEEADRLSKIGTLESEAEQKRLELLGTARTTAEQRIKDKTEAYRQGGEALIGYLKSKGETKSANTKKFVESAVASGVDLTKEELSEYAKSLGVSKSDILSAYNIAKANQTKLQSEQAKAEQERLKTEAERKKIEAETGIIPLTGERARADIEKIKAETGKTNAEIYKLQNPEKDYKNIKEVDGGLFDLEKGQWVVAPKDPQAEYILDKDGRVFNKTKGVWADTGTTTAPTTTANIYANDEKVSEIDSLLKDDSGILSAVGTYDRGLLSGLGALEGAQGKTQNFIAGVEQLIKGMTLQGLIDAKSQGATFGALSEGELKLLSDSASKIGTWAEKDKNGNVTGYNVDEKSFKEELQKIQNGLKEDKALKLGIASKLSENEVRRLINEYGIDNTLEELQTEYEQSGNTSGGGGTPIASNAQAIVDAIKQTESSGNYNVKGASGETGAYQFMPSTWSAYSKEYSKATGEPISAQTPENQDKVAQWKVQQWLDKGYDAKQIASMWNAGEGRPDAWKNWKGVNALGVAYDTPAYVKKVLSNLG